MKNNQLGSTSTRRKLKFEQEAANFVSTFKALVQEIQEVSNFCKGQYLEEKKVVN